MADVVADLASRGVKRLMVEGGGKLHTQFLVDDLADELQETLDRHRDELAAARAARGQMVVAAGGGTALVPRYPLAVPRRTTTTMGGQA